MITIPNLQKSKKAGTLRQSTIKNPLYSGVVFKLHDSVSRLKRMTLQAPFKVQLSMIKRTEPPLDGWYAFYPAR
jgi:hypothetical protein